MKKILSQLITSGFALITMAACTTITNEPAEDSAEMESFEIIWNEDGSLDTEKLKTFIANLDGEELNIDQQALKNIDKHIPKADEIGRLIRQRRFSGGLIAHYISDNGGTAKGQCRRPGTYFYPFKKWGGSLYLDMDESAGGCLLSLAIYDPQSRMRGENIYISMFSTRRSKYKSQCKSIFFNKAIPQFSRSHASGLRWATMHFDTDDRPGGCYIAFNYNSRYGNELLVENRPMSSQAKGKKQCDICGPGSLVGNGKVDQLCKRTRKTVFNTSRNQTSLMLVDTDDRDGSCRWNFRLNAAER